MQSGQVRRCVNLQVGFPVQVCGHHAGLAVGRGRGQDYHVAWKSFPVSDANYISYLYLKMEFFTILRLRDSHAKVQSIQRWDFFNSYD